MLSERAKELIPKARIFTVESIKDKYPENAIAIFQQADDDGEYLTDNDLQKIQENIPELVTNLNRVKLLRDKAAEIVDQARKEVLIKFPQITQSGGGLYPPIRAEACWRDFWHFLRCISYGVAGKITNFTSEEGLKNMELLYQELKVPLPAMIIGLENLKIYSLAEFSTSETEEIATYFDHLIIQMKQFATSS